MNKFEDTYLYKYREAIRKGEIKAGRDLVDELDNLIEDYFSDEYRYITDGAYLRMDFIENCCLLVESPFYGKPFVLLLWQKAFIEVAYSFKIKSIDSGEWVDRFLEILLLITRKGGKTELIAALLFAELIVGNAGSSIVCSGTNDKIADHAYQKINKMRLLVDPKSVRTWCNQKGIKCFFTNSMIYKLSDSSRNKDGYSIDYCGIDEVWSLLNDELYNSIVQSGSAKDFYKLFMFGSEGFVEDGFLDQKRNEYMKIVRCEDSSEAAKRKLPWIYSMDSENEVWETDENGINKAWEKANPSIGTVKKWSYLRNQVEEARGSKSKRMFVLSKDFNFKMSNASSWLMREDYIYTNVYDLEEFRDSVALGAVDLAETTDLACAKILLMKPNDKRKYIHTMYFIPESKLTDTPDITAGAKYAEWARQGILTVHEGNVIDIASIADWFQKLYEVYGIHVYKIGYDNRSSKDFLKRCDDFNFEYEMILQGLYLSNAMKYVETDFRSQLIYYNENEIDMWCLGNCAMKIDDLGKIQPVKQKMKEKKIDGAVTLIMLYEMYMRYRKEFHEIVG